MVWIHLHTHGVFSFQYFTDIFIKVIWSDARELEDPRMVVLVKELKSLQKSTKASSALSKHA